MMAADSLHVAVHRIVPSGVSFCWQMLRCWPCHREHSTNASAPHCALPSNVQTSCLERARPLAIGVFAGERAASSTAPPGRRCPERKRRAKAEGKTKGCGTRTARKASLHMGKRGTEQLRRRAAWGAAYWEHSYD